MSYLNWYTIYMTILRDGGRPLLRTSSYEGPVNWDVSPEAVRNLRFLANSITFQATFKGQVKEVSVYHNHVLGLDDVAEE